MKRSLFAELKRRHVYRVAVAYTVVGWLLVEVASQLFPFFSIPNWSIRLLVFFAIAGFPIALVLAWAFELTPEGMRRTEPADSPDARPPEQQRHIGRTLDFVIIGVLVVTVALLAWRVWGHHAAVTESSVASERAINPGAQKHETPASTAPASPTITTPAKSIAVLPFTNLSDDKKQDYFADGISENLLNLLTRIPQLQVTARTSSFAFKGQHIDIHEIARTLHVANVLEGSVQKAGNEVRITAQLVDVSTDRQLWSQSYDRKLTDVFRIQDQIAADVVKNLKVKLLGAVPTVRPTDPKAYALYLQGRELGRLLTIEAIEKSENLYRQTLVIDPDYAPAWNGLSWNIFQLVNLSVLPQRDGMAHARAAAEKALAIDPNYAPAYAQLGVLAMIGGSEFSGAARQLQRALAIDPTNLDVLRDAALLLRSLGRMDEAITVYKAIVRRDPVNVMALAELGHAQCWSGRYDAAIASYRTALSLSPGMGQTHSQLGMALLLKGDAKDALAEIKQETSKGWRMNGFPAAYCALGNRSEADKAFAALIATYPKGASFNIAYDYAYCGETDKAFEWLDKAVEYKDPGLTDIVPENLFDKIHKDPRWVPFLRKLGKAPDQLAKIKFKVTLPKAWQQGGIAKAETASSGAQ